METNSPKTTGKRRKKGRKPKKRNPQRGAHRIALAVDGLSFSMLGASLFLLPTHMRSFSCTNEADCSLLGNCSPVGKCQCDPGWQGVRCDLPHLALLAARSILIYIFFYYTVLTKKVGESSVQLSFPHFFLGKGGSDGNKFTKNDWEKEEKREKTQKAEPPARSTPNRSCC